MLIWLLYLSLYLVIFLEFWTELFIQSLSFFVFFSVLSFLIRGFQMGLVGRLSVLNMCIDAFSCHSPMLFCLLSWLLSSRLSDHPFHSIHDHPCLISMYLPENHLRVVNVLYIGCHNCMVWNTNSSWPWIDSQHSQSHLFEFEHLQILSTEWIGVAKNFGMLFNKGSCLLLKELVYLLN